MFLMLFNNLNWVVHKQRREGVVLAAHIEGGQPKIQLSAITKAFEFENLGTVYQKYMKLGPDIYHINTFRLPKNEAVNKRKEGEGGESVAHTKKHQKMP